jgi:hypothetical protein
MRAVPDGVENHSRDANIALQGKHTQGLYDTFKWREVRVLAQLRTGVIGLKGCLRDWISGFGSMYLWDKGG